MDYQEITQRHTKMLAIIDRYAISISQNKCIKQMSSSPGRYEAALLIEHAVQHAAELWKQPYQF